MASEATRLIGLYAQGLIGEKSYLKQCQDCKKYFYYLEGDRWCEECFEIGLCKDMNEHFENFINDEFKQAEVGNMALQKLLELERRKSKSK